MTLWVLISVVLLLFYICLIGYYWVGWMRLKPFHAKPLSQYPKVSVIVPVRNEEANMTRLLTELGNQNYPKEAYEVIIVDDHSEDYSVEKVMEFQAKANFKSFSVKLIQLKEIKGLTFAYKKAAITEGVKEAQGEYILTTDADCTIQPQWISTMAQGFLQMDAKLISGPVVFETNSLFAKLQQLEFAGLVGIGAAAINLGAPNMCNGANMGYAKAVFNEVEGYKGVAHLSSGDDELLMHKVAVKYPRQVKFLRTSDALVVTPPSGSLKEFVNQRRRWVSKSTQYEDKRITVVLSAAYLFNLNLLMWFLAALFGYSNWAPFLFQIIFKACIEGLFLYQTLKFFKKSTLLWLLIPAEFFHILYVIFIGILGNIGTFNWKGRQTR